MPQLHPRFERNGVRLAKAGDAEIVTTIAAACWRRAYADILSPQILDNRSIDESAGRWPVLRTLCSTDLRANACSGSQLPPYPQGEIS